MGVGSLSQKKSSISGRAHIRLTVARCINKIQILSSRITTIAQVIILFKKLDSSLNQAAYFPTGLEQDIIILFPQTQSSQISSKKFNNNK